MFVFVRLLILVLFLQFGYYLLIMIFGMKLCRLSLPWSTYVPGDHDVSRWMGQYPKSNGCSCQFGLVQILSVIIDGAWSTRYRSIDSVSDRSWSTMDAGMESSNPVRLTNPLGLVVMALRWLSIWRITKLEWFSVTSPESCTSRSLVLVCCRCHDLSWKFALDLLIAKLWIYGELTQDDQFTQRVVESWRQSCLCIPTGN
jgi:hypothetical protein